MGSAQHDELVLRTLRAIMAHALHPDGRLRVYELEQALDTVDDEIERIELRNKSLDDQRAANIARRIEIRAKEIYDSWRSHDGWVPWQDGGNSDKQYLARKQAREQIDPA